MELSDAGLALIKHFEGYCEKAYLCPASKLTVGYGHVLVPSNPRDKAILDRKPVAVTEDEATQMLREDVRIAVEGVNKFFGTNVSYSQGIFDAFVDFAYNAGIGNMRNSQAAQYWRGVIHEVPRSAVTREELLGVGRRLMNWGAGQWNKAPGLQLRRYAEAHIIIGDELMTLTAVPKKYDTALLSRLGFDVDSVRLLASLD